MGLFAYILAALANLLLMAVDLATLLVLARWFCMRSQNRWAQAVNTATAPAVDAILLAVDRFWATLRPTKTLSARGKLTLAMIMLVGLRIMLMPVWIILR